MGAQLEREEALVVAISFTLAGQQFELSDADVRTRVANHHPDQIYQYWVDVDGTRWPVKQVLALATRTPDMVRKSCWGQGRFLIS